MAQDFTASMRQLWASEHDKIDGLYSPAERLCGKEAEASLRSSGGNSYTFLEIGLNEGMDIEAYGDLTVQDSSDTISTLTLNLSSQYSFHQEEDEKGRYQAFDSFRAQHFKGSVLEHYRKTNSEFFFKAFLDAEINFDDGDLGGTAGNPITITKDNIDDVAEDLSAELEEESEMGGGFAIVLTPKQLAKLKLSAYASGAAPVADALHGKMKLGIENSYLGSYFETDFYKTNLMPQGQEVTYTGQPTAGQSFIINGVTYKAVASLTGGDGEFLIEATADGTYTNAVTLANNPTIDNAKAKGWTKNSTTHKVARYNGAKINTTDGILTLVSKNKKRTITETLSNATLGTDILAFNLLTRVGAIEMACPRGVRLTDGTNKDGTVRTYTSRKTFGVAIPSQRTKRFAVIKTKVA